MTAGPSLVLGLRAFPVACAAVLLLGACAPAARQAPGLSGSPAASAAAAITVLTPTEPPADLDPVKRFAWQQVVHLGEAFAAGDADAFLAKVSRGFYRGYTVLESALKQLMGETTDRAAVVAVREVSDEEGRVSVRAEWTRRVTRRDGSVDARQGETVFLFLKSDTSLRLLDYRGDPPFAIDGI